MKIIRYLFLLFFVLTIFQPVRAQVPELINNPDFRTDAKAAVDSVYNLNFEGAQNRLSDWKDEYPDHPLWILFEGMQLWWTVLTDLHDRSHDEQFFEMMKKTDYQAGKLLHRQPNHVDGLLIRAISNGYMARQYANREEWITSINYGRKAIQAYNYLLDIQPELNDLKLAEGLKLYYLDYIPDEYPVVKTVSWALPDGDKKKGLEAIENASKNAIFAQAEAIYFLGNIHYNYEKNFGVAVRNFEKLNQRYPNNSYYVRVLVKSYYKQSRFDEALKVIESNLQRWKEKDLPDPKVVQEELLTWKGRILEKRERNDEAIDCYTKAFTLGGELPDTENRSFYVVSGYLAGKLLAKNGSKDRAKGILNNVIEAEAEKEYRQQAEELLAEIN
ncbi:tetratricopeptide repeat protein [Fodinibius sp. AD559]|uniref:tetratricopeptide repeat protein n=1 Tax=Fodinibius sp. AD559 TaxID=3424179 RepID=UPI004046A0E4